MKKTYTEPRLSQVKSGQRLRRELFTIEEQDSVLITLLSRPEYFDALNATLLKRNFTLSPFVFSNTLVLPYTLTLLHWSSLPFSSTPSLHPNTLGLPSLLFHTITTPQYTRDPLPPDQHHHYTLYTHTTPVSVNPTPSLQRLHRFCNP